MNTNTPSEATMFYCSKEETAMKSTRTDDWLVFPDKAPDNHKIRYAIMVDSRKYFICREYSKTLHHISEDRAKRIMRVLYRNSEMGFNYAVPSGRDLMDWNSFRDLEVDLCRTENLPNITN